MLRHSNFASGATTTPSRQRISAFWRLRGGMRRQLATIGAGRPSAAKPGSRRHQSPIAAHRYLRTHQLLQDEDDGCRRHIVVPLKDPARVSHLKCVGDVLHHDRPDTLGLFRAHNARPATWYSKPMTGRCSDRKIVRCVTMPGRQQNGAAPLTHRLLTRQTTGHLLGRPPPLCGPERRSIRDHQG